MNELGDRVADRGSFLLQVRSFCNTPDLEISIQYSIYILVFTTKWFNYMRCRSKYSVHSEEHQM